MQSRKLGPFTVSAIGLGCMNLSHAYGTPISVTQGHDVLNKALDLGVTHFDTAALYGFGANEELVGPVLKRHRDRIILASKGGMAGVRGNDGVMRRVINGRPEAIRRNVEDSLRRLGTDVIDLYYLHRWDKSVPIEESVGTLGEMVTKGHIRTIGLSEVSAPTLRRASKEHKIAALQTEYSLWTRNPEIAVLEACRELDVTFVAFSPLARAFLTGRLTDVSELDAKDIRRTMPRFEPENFAKNLRLLPKYVDLARRIGCTPGQLALAWVLGKGDDIIPIPGTASLDHLAEDIAAADVVIPADVVAEMEALISEDTVIGHRYNAAAQADVDTEEFPAKNASV